MEKKKKIVLIIVAVVGLLLLCCGGTVVASIVFKEQLKTETILEKYLGIKLDDEEKEEKEEEEDDDKEKEDEGEDEKKELTPEEALDGLKNFSETVKNSKEEINGYMNLSMVMVYEGQRMTADMNMDFTMDYVADYEKKLLEGRMDFVAENKTSYDPSSDETLTYNYDVFVKENEVFYKKDGENVYSDDMGLGDDMTPPEVFDNMWDETDVDQEILDSLTYIGEEKYNGQDCYKYEFSDSEKVMELLGGEMDIDDLVEEGNLNFDKALVVYWVDKKTGIIAGMSMEIVLSMSGVEEGMTVDMSIEVKMSQVFNEINKGVDIEVPRELR